MSSLNLLSFVLANIQAFVLGIAIIPPGLINSISIRLSVRLFATILVASFSIWFVGIIGILHPLGLHGVLLSTLFFLSLTTWTNLRASIQETLIDLAQLRNVLSGRWVCGTAIIGFGIILARSWIHVQLLPPYIWDALSYHLPKIGDWVQHESLVALPTPITRSYWPASFELLQAWSVVFFHHDWMVEAAGLPYYLLSIVVVYGIGRRLGLTRAFSLLASWGWATTPALLMNAVSCKNDIAIVALFLFAILLILAWKDGLLESSVFWLILMTDLCWGVGIKATMVFMAPGLLLIFFVRKNHRTNHYTPANKTIILYLSALFVITVLPATYWYLRNYIIFDNPFYPVDFRFLGHLIFGDGSGGGQQGTFKIVSLFATLKSLFFIKIFDLGLSNLTADLGNQAGWGWLVVLLGLPCLIVSFIVNKRLRWIFFVFLISFAGLYSAVDPDPWNMRFGFWIPALFCLSWVVSSTISKRNIIRWSFIQFGVICGVLNIVCSLGTGYMKVSEWRELINTPLYLRSVEPAIRRKVLKGSKHDETVGYFVGSNYQLYRLYSSDFPRKIRFIDLSKEVNISLAMQNANIRMIYVQGVEKSWLKRLDVDIESGRLEKYGDWGFYRLRGD